MDDMGAQGAPISNGQRYATAYPMIQWLHILSKNAETSILHTSNISEYNIKVREIYIFQKFRLSRAYQLDNGQFLLYYKEYWKLFRKEATAGS